MQLPNDVWLEITHHLQRKDLKTFRLVNKTFASLATICLFRRLIIRPNYDSLKRAIEVAKVPGLARVVKTLELRAETVFQDVEEIALHMKQRGIPNAEDRAYGIVDFGLFLAHRGKLTAAEKRYEDLDEPAEITYLCKSLPSLRRIRRLYGNWWSTQDQMEFTKIYGLFPSTPRPGFSLETILTACSAVTCRSLRLNKLTWEDFQADMVSQRERDKPLRSIQNLELMLEATHGLDNNGLSGHIRCFSTLIAGLGNIRHLSLELDIHGFWQTHTPGALWKVLFHHRFEQLQSLDLHSPICTEQRIFNFCVRHAATLKRIRLTDLTLCNSLTVDQDERPSEEPSVLRLLWSLPYCMALESFLLYGGVAGCGQEKWDLYMSEAGRCYDSRLKQLEDYVCGNGDFPFPIVAKQLNFEGWLADISLSSAVRELAWKDQATTSSNFNSNRSTISTQAAVSHTVLALELLWPEDKWQMLASCSDESFEWTDPESRCTDWRLDYNQEDD